MMKKSLLILSLFILSVEGFSQRQQFFDSPFGGGGGFTPGWEFANVNSLNNKLSLINMPRVSSKGVFTTGGGGFIYIGFVPGLRIGGMGYGGSTSTNSTITNASGQLLYNTETLYSTGGGGLTIEYTLPFIKSIGVSPGLIIGGGNITVELYQNGVNNGWDGLGLPQGLHNTLNNNFWLIAPTINFEIPFYRFFCIRVGAGYNFTLGEKWTLNNNQSFSGVPSDFNGKNFFIQTGIFIGFFSF
jgi:hypothetical protein